MGTGKKLIISICMLKRPGVSWRITPLWGTELETVKCFILPWVLFLWREAYQLGMVFKPDKARDFNALESLELPDCLAFKLQDENTFFIKSWGRVGRHGYSTKTVLFYVPVQRTRALFFPCHRFFLNGFQTNGNKQKVKLTVNKRCCKCYGKTCWVIHVFRFPSGCCSGNVTEYLWPEITFIGFEVFFISFSFNYFVFWINGTPQVKALFLALYSIPMQLI